MGAFSQPLVVEFALPGVTQAIVLSSCIHGTRELKALLLCHPASKPTKKYLVLHKYVLLEIMMKENVYKKQEVQFLLKKEEI